jgi:hypothetical protein
MRRLLLSHPPWVTHFLTSQPLPMLLLPAEHYTVLHEALAALTDPLPDGTPAALDLSCVPRLITLPAARSLARELALYSEDALAHVLKAMSAPADLTFIPSLANGPNFRPLLAQELPRLLFETFGQESAYFDLSRVLQLLGDAIPFAGVQFLAAMLAGRDPRARSSAVAVAAGVPERFRDFLQPYVNTAFNDLLERRAEPQALAATLDAFPHLAFSHREQLLGLVGDSFSCGSPRLPLIGAILDRLLPERTALPSSRWLADSQREITTIGPLPIPSFFLSQCEDVWRVISLHFATISREVAANPALLRSHLRFLLKYPELLDLRQKTAYFRSLQSGKLTRTRLKVEVRRSEILRDSFRRLRNVEPADWLGHLFVRFRDEPGIDDGGLTREWFELLVKDLFDPLYGLFGSSKNHGGHQPHPSSQLVVPDACDYFRFAGAVIARAMIQNIAIDAHLTSSFLKHILGRPPSLRDVQEVEPEVHSSLVWIQQNEIAEDQNLFFAIPKDEIRAEEIYELLPEGADVPVTEENKAEYVSLVTQYMLRGRIEEQIDAFCRGFYGLIPREEITFLEPNELDLLICGVPEVSIADLRANCEFSSPYNSTHPVVLMLFAVLEKWDSEKLAKFLIFVTGSSQVPLGGFAMFSQAGTPIRVQPGGTKERLPSAHTCINTLDLPEYEDEDEMQRKLLMAIYECSTFGMS